MKKLILLSTFLFTVATAIAQTNSFQNSSFEGISQAHIVPAPWVPCFNGGSPDTQPGQWGITLPPSDGNTYVSFLMAGDSVTGYREGASQQISSCLFAGVTYTISVDLAFSNIYQTAEPGACYGSFGIWGGNGECGQNELLAYAGPLADTSWNTYTFYFTPTSDWCYLSFGPIYQSPCSGYINCLVDNVHDFYPTDMPDLTTINGKAFYDIDADCSYDSLTDYPLAYKLIELQPNNRYALTDINGNYSLAVLATTLGEVNVDCDLDILPTFDVICPDTAGHNLTLNGVADTLTGYNFSASSSLGPCTLLNISTMSTPHRPILDATRYVYITNNSTIPVTNAVLTIEYADTLVWPENIILPLPLTWTWNNNILSINLPTLTYGQNLQFSYNEEVNDFAQLGMQTVVNLSITPQNTCNITSIDDYNDTYTHVSTIMNSYDPNDKQATPAGQGENHEILKTDDIEYTIRFQNLGTDTAFIVQVRDTLDNRFDITTLNIGQASHPFGVELVNNNVLVYTFNNILLPPASTNEEGSIGMFTYKIAQKQSNIVPYQINNRAHIYFDLNNAVITNTYTHNVVDVLNINEDKVALKPLLYPNPARNTITLDVAGISKANTANIKFYNTSGQLVKFINHADNTQNIIDINNLPIGLYYYTVSTTKGFGNGKFVKE